MKHPRRIFLVTLAAVLSAALVIVIVQTGVFDGGEQDPSASEPTEPGPEPDEFAEIWTPQEAAGLFLDEYVDPDGRVVRRDQDDDTVSEGQAYGMLVAAGAGEEEIFASIWAWTQENLQRSDGLLAWRWADGEVADPEPASDADLDAARALILAAERFDEPAYSAAAVELGQAVLDLETAETDLGLVLVAGPWAQQDPYQINPSYPTPVATRLLAELDDDPRWAELDAGNRAVITEISGDGMLPPDWAQIHAEDGRVEAMPAPNGNDVMFGYDAARTLVRFVESCEIEDREAVAATVDTLNRSDDLPAQLDLGGTSVTDDEHPLTYVARAAVRAHAGDRVGAESDLAAADAVQQRSPTYFGAAWVALGRLALQTEELGGCPPLTEDAQAGEAAAGDAQAGDSPAGAAPASSVTSGADPGTSTAGLSGERLRLQPGGSETTGPREIDAERAEPVRVRIAEIGVESELEHLARDAAGVLQDPADPEVAGWYSAGAVPGSRGPAVVAGHVDSGVAGAVFRDLDQLGSGSLIEVDLSDGSTQEFRVDRTLTVPQSEEDFPTDLVYGPVPDAQLRLITCQTFDRAQGRYTDNLVVLATALS